MDTTQSKTWNNLFDEVREIPTETLKWWLSDLLDASLTSLPMHEVPTEQEREQFRTAAHRLKAGEPVQYVCGRAPFRNLTLRVDSRVLIPRPETEQLVQLVLDTGIPPGARVTDVGTGSGCIALAIKSERPDCRVSAVDISPDALDLARANAAHAGLDVEFTRSDLLEQVEDHSVDILVANLPYIAEEVREKLPANVRDHEPGLALFAEDAGTHLVVNLMHQAVSVLKPGGTLFLETGEDQGDIYRQTAEDLGVHLESRSDLAGRERFWIFTVNQPQSIRPPLASHLLNHPVVPETEVPVERPDELENRDTGF